MLHQIRDWLYTGSYDNSANLELLRQYQIRAVLQLERPVTHEAVNTLFLHVQDGYPLRAETLARALDFVRQQRTVDARVLIACNAGISRSPTLAAVMLKELEGLSLHAAFTQVRAVNPDALPDQVIWDSLCEYYGEGPAFWDLWQELMNL